MLDNITGIEYTAQKDGLQLFLRRNGREFVIPAPIKPYFFVLKRHKAVVEYYAKRLDIPVAVSDTDYVTLEKEPVVKVEVEHPQQVSRLRDTMSIKTFEADIPFVRRVMLDMDWKTSTSYDKLYYDVEVRDDKIVCIAVASEVGNIEVLRGDEKSILEQFFDIVSLSDMTVGYNAYNYDFEVVKERARKHKLKIPPLQRWYDILPSLRWIVGHRMLPSYSLDYVGRYFLKMERAHTDKPFSQLTLQEIYERCQRDVEILRELDKNLKLSQIDILRSHISYIFPDETVYITRCLDTLLLRKARQLGYVLPNKPVKPSTEKHSGAFVAQPPEPFKVYGNVLFLDVVSMYPSIIIKFKVSPDAPERQLYPHLLSELYEKRLEYKKLYRETGDDFYYMLQYAYKITLNAAYGAFNSVGFRVQRVDLGDEVATRGRELVKTLIDGMRDIGYDVIYADTDSVAICNVSPDVKIFEYLAETASRIIKNNFGVDMTVEAKSFYSKLYFPSRAQEDTAAKKKYAGLLRWSSDRGWIDPPEVEIVGFECVRSDFPEAAKNLQRMIVREYLNGKDKRHIRTLISDFKHALYSGLIPHESLAYSRSITRKDYKVNAPHVRVAKKLIEHGINVSVGDKVQFVYTKFGVMPLELLKVEKIEPDYDRYWKHVIRPLIMRTLGITEQVSLLDYTVAQ